MREKSFRIYWQTLDMLELGLDNWKLIRHNRFFGALAFVLALAHAVMVGAIWWVRSL